MFRAFSLFFRLQPALERFPPPADENGMFRILRNMALGLVLACPVWAEDALDLPAVIVLRSQTITWESIAANKTAESNETLTCSIVLQNVGGVSAANVVATMVTANGITPITTNQNYGTMAPNDTPVARDFTFTVAGPEGRIAQVRLNLSSGGHVVFDVPVGSTAFTYNHWIGMEVPVDREATKGPASEYPSIIHVSGLNGTVVNMRVTLHNYTHEYGEDMNALLISPAGTNIMLMSDCGGGHSFTNINLAFDSTITNWLSTIDTLQSGTFSASDYNSPNEMASPAPNPAPYGNYLGQLKRSNPNGNWELYMYDSLFADIGLVQGGWSLSLTILPPPRLVVRNNGDNRVRLTLSGLGQRAFSIDYSTNFVDWNLLGQVSGATDPAIFFDSITNRTRYYRARRNSP
jgi:hypothetical protein